MQATSSIGRAPDSKSGGWGFNSLVACQESSNRGAGMTLDNQRIMQGGLYVMGVIVGYVLYKFVTSIVDLVAPNLMLGSLPLDRVIGFGFVAAGIGAAEFARRHPVANQFFLDVIGELRKVTWPNWKEVRGATVVVLVMTFVVAILLFLLDKIFDLGLKFLL